MYIDFLIKIKNAQQAGHKFAKTPSTKMNRAVAEILLKLGFLSKVETKKKGVKTTLEAYLNPQKPMRGLKFISRPSVNRYVGYKDLRSVKSGFGSSVISTSRGVMTGEQAKKDRVGGQALFQIW